MANLSYSLTHVSFQVVFMCDGITTHLHEKTKSFYFTLILQCASLPSNLVFFFFFNKQTNLINHPSAVPNLINAPPYKIPQPTACCGGRGSEFTCFSSHPCMTFRDAIHRSHKRIPVVGGHWVSGHPFITACEPGGTDRGKVFPGQGSAKMPHAQSSVTWPPAILDDSWACATLT